MSGEQNLAEGDWYGGRIPDNVVLGEHVYVDSSYSFAPFLSQLTPGMLIGYGAGVYDRATLIVGPSGYVSVGSFTCLNATYLICNDRITIGSHCLLAWGSVITDSWLIPDKPSRPRRHALLAAAQSPDRWLRPAQTPRPVVLEDNVWVGFDAVVLPGVTLGRGCVVGAKTIVRKNVPPYAVVVGDPARIVRYLESNDTTSFRQLALAEYANG